MYFRTLSLRAFNYTKMKSLMWTFIQENEVLEPELEVIGLKADYTMIWSNIKKLNINLRNQEFRERFLATFSRKKDSMSTEDYINNSLCLININRSDFSVTGKKGQLQT